ncbi:MAG: glycosyltransferase family protein [Candidatus Anstonellales archaeon]
MKATFFVEGIGYGHASRMLPIIQRFKKREVISYGTGARFLSSYGVEVRKIPEPYNLEVDEEGVDWVKTIVKSAKAINPKILATSISALKDSDVVIVDSTPLGIAMGKMMGIKTLVVLNQIDPSTFFSGFFVRKITEKLFTQIFSSVDGIAIVDFPPPFNISPAKRLDTNIPIRFVGPTVKPKKTKKTKKGFGAVVSGGSDTSTNILHVLKKSKYNYFIKGSRKERMRNINFVKDIRDYMLQSEFCILHGGHTSIMECVLMKKPMVVAPLENYTERVENAQGVERLGLGVLVNPRWLDENVLDFAIEKALSLRPNLKRFYSFAKNFDGAKEVEKFAKDIIKA